MRIGSLFSGYGGLDMGVQAALGGTVAWHSEVDPGACRILDHRFPDVPNLGDITTVDWSAVEPVDVLTGGFPCQDVSHAGKRLGMKPGTRSGLWSHMAYAIDQLRPALVVAENVRGLLSAEAHSDLEPCPWCLGDDEPVSLRALGGVLGDLADIGYDARWCGLRAADVGAPHGRFRVFVIAWPAADAGGQAARLRAGLRESQQAGLRRGRPDNHYLQAPTADTDHAGRGEHGRPIAVRAEQPAAERRRAPADPLSLRCERRRGAGDVAGAAGASEGDRGERERHGDAADDRGATPGRLLATPTAAIQTGGPPQDSRGKRDLRLDLRELISVEVDEVDAVDPRLLSDGVDVGRPVARDELESYGDERAPDRGLDLLGGGSGLTGGNNGVGRHSSENPRPAESVNWGAYRHAVHRWERLTRPAPSPTELGAKGQPRLSPAFVEWLMGLPAGWVTDVPGLGRNQQLKALGNGVVPQQAAAALRLLLADQIGVAA